MCRPSTLLPSKVALHHESVDFKEEHKDLVYHLGQGQSVLYWLWALMDAWMYVDYLVDLLFF